MNSLLHLCKPTTVAAFLATVALALCVLAEGEPVVHIERFDARLDAILAPTARVEVIASGIEWAEGPVWNAREGALWFSDVPRNAVYRWRRGLGVNLLLAHSGYTGRAPFRGREPGSNGLTFDKSGRLVLAQHGDRCIARREEDGRVEVLTDRYQGKRLNSPNDLVYHSSGDLYFTDPPFGLPGTFDDPGRELDFQGVFRLRTDGTLQVLIDDLEAPNGLAFSPDERTLYVSNAHAARPVWMAYPVNADGTVGKGRQFADASADVTGSSGVPDGMKVDQHGNLFAAGPNGVHIFAADGTRLGRIFTGVPTGNVAWGEDGRALYITASHQLLRVTTLSGAAHWNEE